MSLSRKYSVILISTVLMPMPSWAQGLVRDPMLPPPEVLSASGAEASSADGAAQPAVQFLLLSPSRKYAVIDGQMLKLGAQIDQWRLSSITAKGVVMQNDTGSQAISAYPSVQKKVIASGVPAPLLKNRNP